MWDFGARQSATYITDYVSSISGTLEPASVAARTPHIQLTFNMFVCLIVQSTSIFPKSKEKIYQTSYKLCDVTKVTENFIKHRDGSRNSGLGTKFAEEVRFDHSTI